MFAIQTTLPFQNFDKNFSNCIFQYLRSRVNDSKVSGFRVNDPKNMRFRVSDFKMSGFGLTTPKCQILGFRVSNSKLQISRFSDSNVLGLG